MSADRTVTAIRSSASSARSSARSHLSHDGQTALCGQVVKRPRVRDAATEDVRMICRSCKKLHGEPIGLRPSDIPDVIRPAESRQ